MALAVAAVPESLPAVLTLAMALGMERMAKRKAVVRKLTAVEALGSVTVIATDKTGTLTENHMRVDRIDSLDPERAVRAMALVNDADPATGAGDPLELGLLEFARQQGVDTVNLRQTCTRLSEKPFDAAWKYMRVTVQQDQPVSYVKGAPEVVMARCRLDDEQRASIQSTIDHHAGEGFRMLALAWAPGETEQDLHWLGLILLWDPPRAEVPGAIAQAQQAGVRIIMITGDHPATARAIAERIGIAVTGVMTGQDLDKLSETELAQRVMDTTVFARVRPEHKLAIVHSLQAQGQVVAVTGDGVNDAPALKAADVGVAMGQRGSDVSREVADLVLLDDNFSTIVSAIEEGRSIYENIQKFVRTLFSTNVTEVLLIVVGAMVAFFLVGQGAALLLPLTAAQILWVNLLTDSLPALAITTDRNLNVLATRPRDPGAPLMDRPTLLFVVLAGVVGGMVALGLYGLLPRWINDPGRVQTLVFCYLVFVQLSFVLPARRVNLLSQRNPWVIGALVTGRLHRWSR
ncbi:MAG: cation-translocating P-type ATPase [Gammaproteobacteria bacterium]